MVRVQTDPGITKMLFHACERGVGTFAWEFEANQGVLWPARNFVVASPSHSHCVNTGSSQRALEAASAQIKDDYLVWRRQQRMLYLLGRCGTIFSTSLRSSILSRLPSSPPEVLCPASPACTHSIVLCDLLNLAPPETLAQLKHSAVCDHVRHHSDTLAVCPKPACGQILRLIHSSASFGGRVIAPCDLCHATYCLTCSDRESKPIVAHKGYTCEEIQRNSLLTSSDHGHRQRMLKHLNTQCPACHAVFYKFNGCFAVSCQCGAAICGFCMFQDPSGDAHTHVARCPRKPNPGSPFNTIELWHTLRREDHRTKIVQALREIPSKETRSSLLASLARDLADNQIHIDPTEVHL